MRAASIRWLLIAPLAVALAGCPKQEPPTTTAPPGGPPPGMSPGGPPGGPPTGTASRAPAEVGSDALMTGKVKNALITSKVDTGKLNVDTKNGVVTLNGSVPTAAQKSLAEKVARQVQGVTTVKNNLKVGGS